ncbi:MAG TPA: hypothetical protein VFG12_04995, partial [Rhodopila sp.]|nr:hypothetical protein [Rhodopila sp.]
APGAREEPLHAGPPRPGLGPHPAPMAMAAARPGAPANGFMRPNPTASMGGFHPGAAPAAHAAAPAPHPAAASSAKHK